MAAWWVKAVDVRLRLMALPLVSGVPLGDVAANAERAARAAMAVIQERGRPLMHAILRRRGPPPARGGVDAPRRSCLTSPPGPFGEAFLSLPRSAPLRGVPTR